MLAIAIGERNNNYYSALHTYLRYLFLSLFLFNFANVFIVFGLSLENDENTSLVKGMTFNNHLIFSFINLLFFYKFPADKYKIVIGLYLLDFFVLNCGFSYL